MLRLMFAALAMSGCRSHFPEPAHRAKAEVCESGGPWSVESENQQSRCRHDADCIEGDGGTCVARLDGERPYRVCEYLECQSDDDCEGVCDCAGGEDLFRNVCLPPGNCKVDADCGEHYCSRSLTGCGGFGLPRYYCRTDRDECTSNADCESGHCVFHGGDERWSCEVLAECWG